MSPPVTPDDWVPLAEVMRPHGVRGEVRLRLFNKDSDVLLERDEVLVKMKDGEEHEVSIDSARRANEAILMKLYSIDDRDRADELRGALICVRRRDFPPPGEGEFYAADLEGLKVVVSADGFELGTVKELMTYPTVDVLVVKAKDGGKDWEVPMVEQLVEAVDLEAGVVRLKTIEDLER